MTMKICTEFRGFTREIQRERERDLAPAIIRLKSLDTMIVVEDPVRDTQISDESEIARRSTLLYFHNLRVSGQTSQDGRRREILEDEDFHQS